MTPPFLINQNFDARTDGFPLGRCEGCNPLPGTGSKKDPALHSRRRGRFKDGHGGLPPFFRRPRKMASNANCCKRGTGRMG